MLILLLAGGMTSKLGIKIMKLNKYHGWLCVILKPVFIIAIVAVAMIGVMVPSVFATHNTDPNYPDLSQLDLILQEVIFVETTPKNVLIVKMEIKNNFNIDTAYMEAWIETEWIQIQDPDHPNYPVIPGHAYKSEIRSFEDYGISEEICDIEPQTELEKKILERYGEINYPSIPAGSSKNITFCFQLLDDSDSYPFEFYLISGDRWDCGSIKVHCTEISTTITENISNIPMIKTSLESTVIAPFVDTTKDPQHYIDRYNNEPTYKEWFDENYPQYISIYEAVGLSEPIAEQTNEPEYVPEPGYTPEPIMEQEVNCGPGTESVNGICEIIQSEEKSSNGGGCLIATATYGSEMSQQVQQLRELRDNQLLQTESGTQFMVTFNDIYYSFSPTIADMERENPYFKEMVKLAIAPMISSLSLMENANSESEVLGIGISVIMLNLGMYLGIPAIVIVGIRKRI